MFAYVLLYNPLTGLYILSWLFIGVAFLLDMGALAGAYTMIRHRIHGRSK
jgi:uncharacterized membrane protein HdeD (DUF308 family)